jgi:hypothetical protein
MYVEGWRDSKRRRRRTREEKAEDKQRSDERRRKAKAKCVGGVKQRKKIIAKGQYTLILR